jgi:hypothetical protein
MMAKVDQHCFCYGKKKKKKKRLNYCELIRLVICTYDRLLTSSKNMFFQPVAENKLVATMIYSIVKPDETSYGYDNYNGNNEMRKRFVKVGKSIGGIVGDGAGCGH